MKHYERKDWIGYINNEVSCVKRQEMEDHLFLCDSCLEIYLSEMELLDNKDIEKEISSQLIDIIMKKIQDSSNKRKKQNNPLTKIFIYYLTAASITLFLMINGVFDYIGDSIPKATNQLTNQLFYSNKITENFVYRDWLEQIMNTTFNLKNRLDIRDKE